LSIYIKYRNVTTIEDITTQKYILGITNTGSKVQTIAVGYLVFKVQCKVLIRITWDKSDGNNRIIKLTDARFACCFRHIWSINIWLQWEILLTISQLSGGHCTYYLQPKNIFAKQINIRSFKTGGHFHQQFVRRFFVQKFWVQLFRIYIFGFYLFWRENIGAKAVFKMLVKLTPGVKIF
jgi:hypothetical protein